MVGSCKIKNKLHIFFLREGRSRAQLHWIKEKPTEGSSASDIWDSQCSGFHISISVTMHSPADCFLGSDQPLPLVGCRPWWDRHCSWAAPSAVASPGSLWGLCQHSGCFGSLHLQHSTLTLHKSCVMMLRHGPVIPGKTFLSGPRSSETQVNSRKPLWRQEDDDDDEGVTGFCLAV